VARVAEEYDVVCPHCKKPFRAELIEGATPANRGFKCPNCRLFSPLDRVELQPPETGAAPLPS
jgi:DNA-directed RNA polymerase subunit RPC12/RpoP